MKGLYKYLFVLGLQLLVSIYAEAQTKQNISVLYVGFDPAVPVSEKLINSSMGMGGFSPERFREEFKTRYPAFVSYLNKYFTKVGAVDARAYKTNMSDAYDVTIFDETITAWKQRVNEIGPDGKQIYEAPKYLTEDFTAASIFIGHTAATMGQSVGSKLDWLCLCLDAEAHHLKTEHPIFKGPFKVNLTMEEKATPSDIYHYASGLKVPAKIPMWRVQTEGYKDGKGYRIGLVSRSGGFLDSPDAEYISSGVCLKDVDAVAIGRHANFFLWGFVASPEYMTEEAKQVFANAVVYMKQFKGVKPIARKYNDRITTRDAVDGIIGRLNKAFYEGYKTRLIESNEELVSSLKSANDKNAKGEELTEREAVVLKYNSQPSPIPTWEQYIKNTGGKYYKPEFGTDVNALIKFLEQNKKYMFYDEVDKKLIIDEEVKQFEVGNNELVFFDKMIALLKSGQQTDLANKLLQRYTGMQKSATDWSSWLKQNKSKLFFTDAGGYKWMINTIK